MPISFGRAAATVLEPLLGEPLEALMGELEPEKVDERPRIEQPELFCIEGAA